MPEKEEHTLVVQYCELFSCAFNVLFSFPSTVSTLSVSFAFCDNLDRARKGRAEVLDFEANKDSNKPSTVKLISAFYLSITSLNVFSIGTVLLCLRMCSSRSCR